VTLIIIYSTLSLEITCGLAVAYLVMLVRSLLHKIYNRQVRFVNSKSLLCKYKLIGQYNPKRITLFVMLVFVLFSFNILDIYIYIYICLYEHAEFRIRIYKTLWPRGTVVAAPAKLELSRALWHLFTLDHQTPVLRGGAISLCVCVGGGGVSTAAPDEHVKRWTPETTTVCTVQCHIHINITMHIRDYNNIITIEQDGYIVVVSSCSERILPS